MLPYSNEIKCASVRRTVYISRVLGGAIRPGVMG